METRRGWFPNDKVDDDEKRRKDEKEDRLLAAQVAMVKRCDEKVSRRRSRARRREVLEEESRSRAREAVERKRRELETTHRLAAELSRCKNEEIKRALELRRRASKPSLSSCAANEAARARLVEEKIRLEAKQAELSKLWHRDGSDPRLRRAEEEKRKRKLRVELQNQLADNRRRAQEERTEEKRRDREMVEQIMRKIREEDAKARKTADENAVLLSADMAAALAAKKTWERRYKEALRIEDERIADIVAEKEARQRRTIDRRAELRAAREAAIDKLVRELLDDACEDGEREKISKELHQEEQRSKWAREPARLALRKQRAIADYFKEMVRQQEAVAERKAKNDAIDAAIARYLTEEWKKGVEKQRKHDDARRARNIQYGTELKEAIINNRVSYAMNILERQSEIDVHSAINQSAVTTSEKGPDGRATIVEEVKVDANIGESKCVKSDIKICN